VKPSNHHAFQTFEMRMSTGAAVRLARELSSYRCCARHAVVYRVTKLRGGVDVTSSIEHISRLRLAVIRTRFMKLLFCAVQDSIRRRLPHFRHFVRSDVFDRILECFESCLLSTSARLGPHEDEGRVGGNCNWVEKVGRETWFERDARRGAKSDSPHDARRTAHDARRTTHDARRTAHDEQARYIKLNASPPRMAAHSAQAL